MSEIGDLFCDIAEGFSDVMGWCKERCTHNGICSLDAEHDGAHEAHGSDRRILCSWETVDA